MILLQLSFCILLNLMTHDFHVSVTNAEYKDKTETLQISMKVFIDDLEDAIGDIEEKRITIEDAGTNPEVDSLVFNYIREKFELISEGHRHKLQYVGHETELDICFIYLEVAQFPLEYELSVRNSLFFDRFEDQSNIVNIRCRGEVYSIFLDQQHPVKKVRFG